MSLFSLSYKVRELQLRHVFTISRGSRASAENVFIELSKDGYTGLGEAAPNKRYNETADLVKKQLSTFDPSVLDGLTEPKEVENALNSLYRDLCPSAQVAIEMCWLDWWGKSKKGPLWQLLGCSNNQTPVTSYTIGIDSLDVMKQKVIEAEAYPVLKVKLGTSDDREIIRMIRSVTSKPIRIDANEGWTNLEQAKTEIEFLESNNIEMIEQPMPSSMLAEMRELKNFSSIPLCADESFVGSENLDEIAEAFHCINIKLMKVGSVLKAIRICEEAHKKNLKVMIGCMIESSLAISAGALVGLSADYVDLDGFLLISNDPFQGVRLSDDYELVLSDGPGLGVAAL